MRSLAEGIVESVEMQASAVDAELNRPLSGVLLPPFDVRLLPDARLGAGLALFRNPPLPARAVS